MNFDMLFAPQGEQTQSFSQILIALVLGLALTLFFTFVLKKIYEKHSSSVDVSSLSKLFTPLALSVFIVVFVIKSSWMVSIGLLGALAIVRFRTPVKSAEDLSYIFISVVIGIGFAAGNILLVGIGVVVVFASIVFYGRGANASRNSGFSCLISHGSLSDDDISKVRDILTKHVARFVIQRISSSSESSEISIFIDLNEDNIEDLHMILRSELPGVAVSFFARTVTA